VELPGRERLYRSREGKMIAGVCSGLAHYFDIDVSLVRLGWVLLTLVGGSGLLAYIIAWIVIPEAPPGVEYSPPQDGQGRRADGDGRRGQARVRLVGTVLVLIGAYLLLDRFLPLLLSRNLIPLALIAIGAALLMGYGGVKDDPERSEDK